MRLDFDGQRSSQDGFIGNQSVKLGKGPLRVHPVGFAHLRGGRFGPFAPLLALAFGAARALLEKGQVPVIAAVGDI
jgi:hypothetical protein